MDISDITVASSFILIHSDHLLCHPLILYSCCYMWFACKCFTTKALFRNEGFLSTKMLECF